MARLLFWSRLRVESKEVNCLLVVDPVKIRRMIFVDLCFEFELLSSVASAFLEIAVFGSP